MNRDQARLAAIRAIAARIPDPEIPVVTLEDLGILRDVVLDEGTGAPAVLLTPTYSGCPATEAIAAQVREALDAAGFGDAQVRTVLSPAWSTDWISEDGRRKLLAFGIAPPACGSCSAGRASAKPACPQCGAVEVEPLSRWGSTPCKALYRCLVCREPFDYFKPY
jgi:ring-1,2-phenylacetyl-CoA epoxidase subunit PaaD